MRIVLILLIVIHGVIHLMGFLKAYHIYTFNSISQSISKPIGIVWLLTFVLLAVTVFFLLTRSNFWWLTGGLAVLISQILVLTFWADAKMGTLANLILLFTIIHGYSSFSFKQKISEERRVMFQKAQSANQAIVSEENLEHLPPIVKTWLMNSGVIGRKFIYNVHLVQDLEMRLKPNQTNWNPGKAEQYFTVYPPAFNWSITTEMNPLFTVVGRDQFIDGKGEMSIQLLSLIPVVNVKESNKLNQAALQRFLAEIVWFPTAALSPYITWETLDATSARATMEYQGAIGSGVFHFDENGSFKKFVAMRYRDVDDEKTTEWTVSATQTAVRNGIKIPVECKASWKLENGKWDWLKVKIRHIEYNSIHVEENASPKPRHTRS